jgi:AbrB family looped-hinge helix DNA binding protein
MAPPTQVLLQRKSNTLGMDSTLTAKGQATIPKEIRDFLGLKPGDRIRFFKHPDGSVVIKPVRSIFDLKPIPWDGPPVSVEEMDEGIARAAVERYERFLRQDES